MTNAVMLETCSRDELLAMERRIAEKVVSEVRQIVGTKPVEQAIDAPALAVALGVSDSTIHRLTKSGGIPSFVMGTSRRYMLSRVVEALEANTTKAS